jgi:hypothetical protein
LKAFYASRCRRWKAKVFKASKVAPRTSGNSGDTLDTLSKQMDRTDRLYCKRGSRWSGKSF